MATKRRPAKKKAGRRLRFRDERGKFISEAKWKKLQKKKKRKKSKRKKKRLTEKERRSEASLKGWETRRKREAEKKRFRDKRGKFISAEDAKKEASRRRRSEAAKRAWKARKAAAEKRRQAALKGAETRRRKVLERQRRAEAAKLGWSRKRQRQLAESFREVAERRQPEAGPSPALRSLMTDPRWLDGSYHQFEDGSQQGQIVAAPGPPEEIRDRLIELETAVSQIVGVEPVWEQVGITAMPPKMTEEELDRYDEFGGQLLTLTYPRSADNIGASFVGARAIAENMLEAGFRITGLVVRTTFGDRPERYEQ